MRIIGAGVGRTGTYSLKDALERLGFGPCHHMESVMHNMPAQVPLWTAALAGVPDWDAIYAGFESAVDWPSARFFRELSEAYPTAKFVLTHRSPDSWADSFSGTIGKMIADGGPSPPEMREWLEMVRAVIKETGFSLDLDREGLMSAFSAHNEAVKAAIPSDRLLSYEVKEGWAPLCSFLGVPVPDEPFPHANRREEFWDRVRRGG